MPITVPAFHGVAPNLALGYSSRAGDGWVGAGWSLQGLSTITRQSGVHGLPEWSASDTYNMDGQDLLACAGASGSVGASPSCAHAVQGTRAYTAEVESFERIAFLPDSAGGTWRVWRGDGVIADYKPGITTSRGVLDWRLSTVTDPSGNPVTYDWATDSGQIPQLDDIHYSDVDIRFSSAARPDPITTAVGDGLITDRTRLATITETAAGSPIRSYRLQYAVHPQASRQSFLTSVQQFGSDGTTSLPASTFDTSPASSTSTWRPFDEDTLPNFGAKWPSGPDDRTLYDQLLDGDANYQGTIPWPAAGAGPEKWLTIDANHDGLADLAQVTQSLAGKSVTVTVHTELAQPGGGFHLVTSSVNYPSAIFAPDTSYFGDVGVSVADVDGDGAADLVFVLPTRWPGAPQQTYAYVVTAFGTQTGQFQQQTAPITEISEPGASGMSVGDVTGDGRADVVTSTSAAPCGHGGVVAWIGNGSGQFAERNPVCWPNVSPPPNPGIHWQLADVNGDHKSDYVGFERAGTADIPWPDAATARIFTAIATGDGTFTTSVQDTGQAWQDEDVGRGGNACPWRGRSGLIGLWVCDTTTGVPAYWVDANGDGLTDLEVLRHGPTGIVAQVMLSRGDGTYDRPVAWTTGLPDADLDTYEVTYDTPNVPNPVPFAHRFPPDILVGDLNGDGASDLVAVSNKDVTGNVHGDVTKLISDRVSRFVAQPTAIYDWSTPCTGANCPHTQTMIGDLNGDGIDDLIAVSGQNAGAPTQVNTDMGSATPQPSFSLNADVNGDGISDIVVPITGTPDAAGQAQLQIRVFLRHADGTVTPLAPVTVSIANAGVRRLPQSRWMVADLNGDHLADLVNLPPDSPHGVELIATADHGWQEHLVSLTGLDRTIVIRNPVRTVPGTGDVCIINNKPRPCPSGGATTTTTTRTVTYSALLPGLGGWMVADVTGDGIDDLVHTGPTSVDNSAISGQHGILVLTGSADGTLNTEWSSPADHTAQVALAAPRGWHALDVDGDGTADLVWTDDNSGTIETLLRRGTGWTPVSATVPVITQPPTSTTAEIWNKPHDTVAWTPAALNADRAGDLVRAQVAPGSGIAYAEALFSHGDGQWTASTDPMPSGTVTEGGLAGEDDEHWVGADIDQDGHTDLVKVLDRGNTVSIHALLSDGGETWTPTTDWQAIPHRPPAARWQMSGDLGAAIAWHAAAQPNGSVLLSAFRSDAAPDIVTHIDNGLGAQTTVGYTPIADFPDTADFPQGGDSSTNTGRDPSCRLPTGAAASPVVDSITTAVVGSAPTSVTRTRTVTVTSTAGHNTLSGIAAARLGDAARWGEIYALNEHRLQPDGRSLSDPNLLRPAWLLTLPPATPRPAAHAAAGSAAVSDSSTMTYNCPRYSTPLRSFLGWTDSQTTHNASQFYLGVSGRPASTEHVRRSISDYDVVQTVRDELSDANGHLLHRTTSTYQPMTTVPYLNLLASTSTGDCDPATGHCASSTTQVNSYDQDGNVTDELAMAVGSGRLRETTTSYLHEDGPWLQHLPRLVRITDPTNPDFLHSTLNCYDGDTSTDCTNPPAMLPRGLPTLTRAWNGATYQRAAASTYDKWGNQITTSDGAGNPTTTTYDPTLHLHPIAVCNALGQCSRSPEPWDRRADAPTRTTDSNHATTITQYDALGRPTRSSGPTRAATRIAYDTGSAGTTTTTTVTSPGVSEQTRTYTDGLGRTYRTEGPGGNGTRTSVTDTTYLDATLPVLTTSAHFKNQPATAFDTTLYDAAGRPITVVHADGSRSGSRYFLDPSGLSGVTTTDENGHATTRYTDGWGNLIRVEQPSTEHPGTQAVTQYRYDATGDLLSVTDPHGNVLSTDWNPLSEKTAEHDPDRGTTTYKYDAAGNLKQTTDARGDTLIYGYDPLNRQTTKTDVVTGAVSTWKYDQKGHGASIGRLTTEVDPSADGCPGNISRSLAYNNLGDIIRNARCVKGLAAGTTTQYDPLGRPKTLAYPDGLKIGYSYDHAGHLAAINGYITQLQYNAAGDATNARYANGTAGRWTYDPQRSWITSGTLTRASGARTTPPLFADAYIHDPAGLISRDRSSTNKRDQTYGYDGVDQLTSVADTSTGQPVQRLTYDDIGNITANSSLGTYTYQPVRTCATTTTCAGPHAVTAAGTNHYRYDPAGNMTERPAGSAVTQHLSWNSAGLLTRLQGAGGPITNTYDADGTRVQERNPAGTTTFDDFLAEHTKTGWTDYIYAGTALIAAHTPKGTTWYAVDRQQSPRATLDAKGRVTARVNYTAWGRAEGTAPELGYGGHRSLQGTQIIDMSARDYDPTLGKMLSADNVIPDISVPEALNRYSYAYNDPVTNVDPTGHDPADPDQAGRDAFAAINDYINGFSGKTYSQNSQNPENTPPQQWAANTPQDPTTHVASDTPTAPPAVSGSAPNPTGSATGGDSSTGTGGSRDAGTQTPTPGSNGGIFADPGEAEASYYVHYLAADDQRAYEAKLATELAARAAAAQEAAETQRQLEASCEQGPCLRASLSRAEDTPTIFANQQIFDKTIATALVTLGPAVMTGAGAAATEGATAAETFYRTMSVEDFAELQVTGRVPATSETFISPSGEYASGYDGVTVRFSVESGTTDALVGIGVRDTSAVTRAVYPDMPLVSSGWAGTSAFFKSEAGIINIGLGQGTGLDLFNNGIVGWEVAP